MSSNTEFKLIDYDLNGELPDGGAFNMKQSCDGTEADFEGYRAGISGNVALLKAEKQINENVKVGLNGPSAGASLGFRYGSENSMSAMVEPSLCNAEGHVGPMVASVGLNANTGVKINPEGFKFGIFGFGLTAGVGGKYTLDTPFGSAGCTVPPQTLLQKDQPVN